MVQDEEVGEFAHLQRAQIIIEAEVAGAVDRGDLERFDRGHPSLLEHPQLPVGAETLHLPVGPQRDESAGVLDGLGAPGYSDVVVVLVARGDDTSA